MEDEDHVDDAKAVAQIQGRAVLRHIHEEGTAANIPVKYPTYTPYRENVSIRSFNHELKTIKTMKLTLNWHDDKRVILPDRIHTLAHGHYKLT